MTKFWSISLAAVILTAAAVPLIAQSPFDIKPEEDPNGLNPQSEGLIPVVIFSTSAFDAYAEVDETSVRFGRGVVISYWQYIKLGVPVTLAAALLSMAVLSLEYWLVS